MILFESVAYRYEHDAPNAIDSVTLSFRPGELVAIVGANGSGKSTLARLADALLFPSEGRVTVDGLDTADPDSLWEIRSRAAVVFQDPDDQIVGTVVEEDCAFGPENLGLPPQEIRRRVDAALAAVGLSGLERREPHLLSEGQKQRLAVAGALAMRPCYLVLDEPTAMLDPPGRRAIIEIASSLAHDQGQGVLLITHDAAALTVADRAVGLAAGRVAFEGPPELLLRDEPLMASLGLELPPAGRVAAALRREGMSVPLLALDADSLAAALCP